MSLEECVEKARKFVFEYGSCLLFFDVKGSRNFKDRQKLNDDLLIMMEDLNGKFSESFQKNNLAVQSKREKGFATLLGDGSWAGITSPAIVEEIINYQKREYPEIQLYWGVAKDGMEILDKYL
ncbi:MAG: hypothetical protein PHQ66_02640 [Candidatus Nanoarchaeia archaeon]|nr:hypothetical protein [Candidatus Nanoarchaeia archaeon]MDD5357735.1 hypothetical protein [Candidatus Nanoarchaeia archaeon]MDD5588654.1 hypothetical protein [Candidatus Nanoarchaeia archaeon]